MLASRCGYGDGVMFSGDMYVGKVDGPTDRNVDFKLSDMDPGADWVSPSLETAQPNAITPPVYHECVFR